MSNDKKAEEIKSIKDDWHKTEFSTINIGDARLNKRAVKIAGDISNQLSSPINQASNDWNATKAAYNFFNNEKVTPSKIQEPHIENTVVRMKTYQKVLAIQDTTTLNFGSHEAVEGLGNIGKEGTRGFMQHNTLIVTPKGLPLGLIDQIVWTRPQIEEEKSNKSKYIEEKESYKWLQSLNKTLERAPASTEVITVCDREADIFEFFDEAKENDAKLLVRLRFDRSIDNVNQTIKAHLKAQEAVAKYEFEVPKKKGEYPSRIATVEVRYADVTINAPKKVEDSVTNTQIEMTGIYVKEINTPNGVKPIEWFLVTNEDVNNAEDAIVKIMWYRTRWMIEIYHKVLKTCCRIEECRLETIERLKRFIALESVVAWRVLWLTYCNRVEPNAPAETILSEMELIVLEGAANRFRKVRTEPMTIKKVRHAVRAIAMLGGYLGRNCDGEPGIIAVGRGLQRMNDFMAGVEITCSSKLMGNR
jgi:hypothetical protein